MATDNDRRAPLRFGTAGRDPRQPAGGRTRAAPARSCGRTRVAGCSPGESRCGPAAALDATREKVYAIVGAREGTTRATTRNPTDNQLLAPELLRSAIDEQAHRHLRTASSAARSSAGRLTPAAAVSRSLHHVEPAPHQRALQAVAPWHSLGRHPAARDDGRLHLDVYAGSRHSRRIGAVSAFRLRGSRAMDNVFEWAERRFGGADVARIAADEGRLPTRDSAAHLHRRGARAISS